LIACHRKQRTLNIVLGRGRGGTKAFMFLCTHTQKHCLERLSSEAIVLGRGGGRDKSVHVPLHAQKRCTLIACRLRQCTLNIATKILKICYLNISQRFAYTNTTFAYSCYCSAHTTVAGVCARVLQLPDTTSYCCTHAVAACKPSAYALLLVRVRASKYSSLCVGTKSFGSCSSTYACETYDLL